MDNIIFIGMPAVGKSTVGVIVAKRLGYRFVDTDILIQEEEGKLLKDIIKEKGIDGFLEVEDRINAKVNTKKTVISPGGSVVYCENAMKHYKEIGKVVYLQASYETINKRIGNAKKRGVVLKDGQTLRDLYNERVALFEKYADITVCEDGLRLENTIQKVLDALGQEEEA
ncbi:shikimate kinase [Bariatricus sp. SGI.154]|uniref:shikimate kinase n=1 Tax=Bariatricus sp. SGI.154 TaxID=3420549 RepID=UPI003D048EEB